ncbi:MAG: hypothetical protein L6290_00565, partial [Thermodesulfovibrionales bacterium]|nr:hypothetical protein [Thermodesulfovibrionales bacterium]
TDSSSMKDRSRASPLISLWMVDGISLHKGSQFSSCLRRCTARVSQYGETAFAVSMAVFFMMSSLFMAAPYQVLSALSSVQLSNANDWFMES